MKKKLIVMTLILSMLIVTINPNKEALGKIRDTPNFDEYILCGFLGGNRDDLIRDMAIDSEGNILVTGDTMSENFPITQSAFQETFAGGIQDVHTVSGDAFISKFDSTGNLIWSSYLGGSSNDGGVGVLVDSMDNIFVLGLTNSHDFPVTGSDAHHGDSDGFVTKFASNGTLEFSMCIGTLSEENLEGCIMLSSDILTITGSTSSLVFPTTDNAWQRVFGGVIDGTMVQMMTNGSIIYSSYFGGSGIDVLGDINVNDQGTFIINGYSDSVNLPFSENAYATQISGPGRDFFILTLSDNKEVEYCSYFGGSGVDDCFGCTLDTNSNMIFSGRTWSSDFPIVNAWQKDYAGTEDETIGVDAFVTKMNASGDLIFSSYFGGPKWDTLHFVDTDNQNNIYTCGVAPTNDFPISTNAIQNNLAGGSDLILLALTPEGTPYFGTYLGGGDHEHVWNMEFLSNQIYIVGHSLSDDLPTSNNVFQKTNNGSEDGFFLRFDLLNYLENNPGTITQSSTNMEVTVFLGTLVLVTIRRRKKN